MNRTISLTRRNKITYKESQRPLLFASFHLIKVPLAMSHAALQTTMYRYGPKGWKNTFFPPLRLLPSVSFHRILIHAFYSLLSHSFFSLMQIIFNLFLFPFTYFRFQTSNHSYCYTGQLVLTYHNFQVLKTLLTFIRYLSRDGRCQVDLFCPIYSTEFRKQSHERGHPVFTLMSCSS